MKAEYKTKNGHAGVLNYPVILPNGMQHTDGFSLLAFASWEDANDEKLCAAVTNVEEFHIDKEEGRLGFHVKEQN